MPKHRAVLWVLLLAFLAVLASLVLLTARMAYAQSAPQFGGCFGQSDVCVAPDISFNAIRYNLVTKKLSGGALPVGLGYTILWGYSKWWASGLAAHAVANFTQAGPSFVEPSLSLTLFRYLRLGCAWHITDATTQVSLIGGVSVPIELLTTGHVQGINARNAPVIAAPSP
jgi:hypothetical protein